MMGTGSVLASFKETTNDPECFRHPFPRTEGLKTVSGIEVREQAEAKGPGKFFCSAAPSPACVREWKSWKCVRSSSSPRAARPHRSRMSSGWRLASEEKPSLEAPSASPMEMAESPRRGSPRPAAAHLCSPALSARRKPGKKERGRRPSSPRPLRGAPEEIHGRVGPSLAPQRPDRSRDRGPHGEHKGWEV